MAELSEELSKEQVLLLSQKDTELFKSMISSYIVKRLDLLEARLSDMEEMQVSQSEEF